MRKPRLVTLMSCQWADMDLDTLCSKAADMGYDGIELAIWGNHLDPIRAAKDDNYVAEIKSVFQRHGLVVKALCAHVPSQCVGDWNDPRLNNFAPAELANNPQGIRDWAIETMKASAIAARKLGAYCVTGFVGSTIWKYMYSFPQTTEEMVERGFQEIRDLWLPILDVFRENGIKYCLEVHPAEIAFDYWTTKRLLEKMADRPEFGLNFDPSHLQWQGISPHLFLEDFISRVYHVHMKDCAVTLNGRNGILCSHIDFGDLRRGWNFRSLGHGDVNFEEIIRVLNTYGYEGPLSVEWEDSGMDREYGAREACQFVRKIDFPASDIKFDSAIKS